MSTRTIRGLLGLSLALNGAALFLPFVEVSKPFFGSDVYNLVRSVVLLWDSGLVILAGIVVLFSIVFPFAKLAELHRLSGVTHPGPGERRRLRRVEALGKWSLIDVFIVCFILALTNDQTLVDGAARPGLLTFLAAIIVSMFCGERLAHRWGPHGAAAEPRNLPTGLQLGVLTLFSLAYSGALCIPFLQIDEWYLSDTAFTLGTFIWAIHDQGATIVALVIALGLVGVPTFALIGAWVRLVAELRGRAGPRWARPRASLRNWSLLHVFLVAFLIFLAEGEALMTIRTEWGLIFFVVLLLLDLVLFRVLRPRSDAEVATVPPSPHDAR